MVFTSPQFVVFFLLFFAVYPHVHGRARTCFLLAASYFFYGSWSTRFLALLVATTVVDYTMGLAIQNAGDDARRRRRRLLVSIASNLSVLGFFKYGNFLANAATDLGRAFGLHLSPVALNVVLPIGISFYTFQSLSYTIAVYRRKMSACDDFVTFALYVAFFPQLVAGPIERAVSLLPQVSDLERKPDPSGWMLIAMGAFKKAVIADHVAKLVNLTYADPRAAYPLALWVGTYAFALQIYFDFSGYSDIAVGVARLMGVELMQNFRAPYSADGPSDFWRRWHISLSSWLRDYLYIPLGGNRGGPWREARNLMWTMLLGGLWHGARWNFVLWGGFHGCLLLAERLVRRFVPDRALFGKRPFRVVQRLLFFHVTCLGWALFRAETLDQCRVLMTKLLDVRRFEWRRFIGALQASGEGRYIATIVGLTAALFVAHNLGREGTHPIAKAVWRLPAPVRFGLCAAPLLAAALLTPEEPPPFIYFQF